MLPTGSYMLPPLSEFVVTETICPPPVDPNAPPAKKEKEKMKLNGWYFASSVDYDIANMNGPLKEIRFDAPYPDGVELVFTPNDHGYTFVFSDGKRVTP